MPNIKIKFIDGEVIEHQLDTVPNNFERMTNEALNDNPTYIGIGKLFVKSETVKYIIIP